MKKVLLRVFGLQILQISHAGLLFCWTRCIFAFITLIDSTHVGTSEKGASEKVFLTSVGISAYFVLRKVFVQCVGTLEKRVR